MSQFTADWAINAMWGLSSDDLWAVGGFNDKTGGVIAHHAAGGWTQIAEVPRPLSAVYGANESDVWAVGEHGLVMHYDGAGWSRELSGASRHLQAVFAFPGAEVVAAGADGAILKKIR